MLAAVAPRQLDGCLIGLGAAVTKKNAIGKRVAAQLTRELRLGDNMIEIRNVEQLARLLLDGTDYCRMAVAQTVDRDARQEIEVLFAVGIPHPRALAAHQRDGIPGVGVSDIMFCELRNIAVLHHLLPHHLSSHSLFSEDL